MVTTQDVRAAYRLILGREPESEEIVMRHAREAESLEDLRTAFLSSMEFHGIPVAHSPMRPLDWPPIEVEVDASPSQLLAMIAHIEANWHQLGLSEPHWSVITNEAFRASNIVNTEKSFYDSGQSYSDVLRRTAERCGVSLTGFKSCLDLGCGVGRLTVWLAGLFERVVAADISPAHLVLARRALDRFRRTNVDLVHLDSFGALDALPEFDVLISVIVLQHNPPPLIAALLKTVLNKLRPGGIAYFQVPTYHPSYRFRIDEYLRNASPTGGMEMHLIPQDILFDILQQSGCRLLECREDLWTGNYETISNSIFARKQEDVASIAPYRRVRASLENPKIEDPGSEYPPAFARICDPENENCVIDIRDREFWKRYVPFWNKGPSPAPFNEIEFQQYMTDRGVAVRSMLSSFELALIYALGRDYWIGWGKIADLGCLYGLTTRCFAKGLADNARAEEKTKLKTIYAFDLFLVDALFGYTMPSESLHTGSIFPDFLALNADLLRYIAPCPGDISRMSWSGPLEILFIDCAKSWQLNRWVVEHMFPWLREGSIVVQQDYIHFHEYWVHITMEHFADYFEPLYMLYGASSAYRCKRPIDPEKINADLASLPLGAKEEMLRAAMSKAPAPVREVMKCAYASCLLEHGEVGRAREMVESVVTEPLTDDPVLNVALIATTNKDVVRGMIAAAEA